MARDFGDEISLIKDTNDLLKVIMGLKGEGREINEYPEIRLILENLGIDGDLPISVITSKIESLGVVEIKPGQFAAEAERQLVKQGVVPPQIRELLRKYEEYLESVKNPDKVLGELIREYNGRILRSDVERLIKKQWEICNQVLEKLTERNAKDTLGEEGVDKAAEEMAKQVLIMEEKTAGQLPTDRAEEIGRVIREEVINATTDQLLDEKVTPGKLEERITVMIKQLEKKQQQLLVEQIAQIPGFTKASFVVETTTNKITEGLLEELRSDDQLGPILVQEHEKNLKRIIEIKIQQVIRGGTVGVREIKEGVEAETGKEVKEVVVKKTLDAVRGLVKEKEEMVIRVRQEVLMDKIEDKIVALIPRKQALTEMARRQIEEYVLIVKRVMAPNIKFEKYRNEAKPMSGAEERAWSETAGIDKVLHMPPGEFNEMVKYWQSETIVNVLPYDIEEIRATEEIMKLGMDQETRNFINLAQRVVRIYDGVNNLTGGLLKRFGFEKLGDNILGRIGGQAAGEFWRNSAATLAQYGFKEGSLSILKGVIGGGVKVGAAGAVKTGATGILAAIGGISGPPGWILAAGAIVLGLGKKILGGLFEKITGIKLPNLGKLLGLGSKGLSGMLGKLGTAGVVVVGGLLAIPSAVMALAISTAAIGTVVIAVIVGLFGYSMLQSSQISSIVPPMTGSGNESAEYIPGAPGLAPEVIEGECSLADHVTAIKQNSGPWADKELPGGCTFTQSGCGPTSVAKILTRINGTLSPDYLVYEENSTYASMGCDGSSMSQAKQSLERHLGAGRVTYDSVTRGCSKRDIGEWIKHGKIVMVLADFYSNSEASKASGHYTLAVAISGGEIITSDPFYPNAPAFDGKREYGHVYKINECLLIDTGEGCL